MAIDCRFGLNSVLVLLALWRAWDGLSRGVVVRWFPFGVGCRHYDIHFVLRKSRALGNAMVAILFNSDSII